MIVKQHKEFIVSEHLNGSGARLVTLQSKWPVVKDQRELSNGEKSRTIALPIERGTTI
jgi:hypothetical protein